MCIYLFELNRYLSSKENTFLCIFVDKHGDNQQEVSISFGEMSILKKNGHFSFAH